MQTNLIGLHRALTAFGLSQGANEVLAVELAREHLDAQWPTTYAEIGEHIPHPSKSPVVVYACAYRLRLGEAYPLLADFCAAAMRRDMARDPFLTRMLAVAAEHLGESLAGPGAAVA